MSEELTIINRETGLTVRREQIERRLRDDLDRMAEHYIDIGRCLNIVKDEGLVPHGEWIAWLHEHAQMSERNAQRLMRAAREIEQGSSLEELDFSKVLALLQVPAGEREAFAAEVGADSLSVRQLQAAIKERDAAAREKEEALKRAKNAEKRNAELRGQVRFLEKQSEIQTNRDDKSEQEINRLRDELDGAEDELKRRAKAESDAKEELLRLRTQMARGNALAGGERLTADDLATATRAFIGQTAVLPHMGRELAACDQATRDAYLVNINMLADWCERARMALNTFEGEVLADE